jgi:hypothetical protein
MKDGTHLRRNKQHWKVARRLLGEANLNYINRSFPELSLAASGNSSHLPH